MEYYVYRLTRASDGKQYIGTTDNRNLRRRMSAHRKSTRFRDSSFVMEILLTDVTPDVFLREEEMIVLHQTFYPHGLNLTISGKGYFHDSIKWSTRGYKFSEVSRQRMRDAWKRRTQHRGWHHTAERKQQWSQTRRGRPIPQNRKLNSEQEQYLKSLYTTHPTLPGVGKKHPSNGIVLTYQRAFVNHYAPQFNMTPNGLLGVLRRVCSE